MDIHHPNIALYRRRNSSVNRVRDVVKFGIVEDYWLATGSKEMELLQGRDKGKFHDTKKPEDTYINPANEYNTKDDVHQHLILVRTCQKMFLHVS